MSDDSEPLTNGGNGRDPVTGRLLPGHKFAKGGNANASRMLEFKNAIYRAVTPNDVEAIVGKAVAQAKKGDRAAREFLFDRILGKPAPAEILERLEQLESLLASRESDANGNGRN